MDRIVGTCSNCGGPVIIPEHWMGTIPPTPSCRKCQATAKPNHGPVVPMSPPSKQDEVVPGVDPFGSYTD